MALRSLRARLGAPLRRLLGTASSHLLTPASPLPTYYFQDSLPKLPLPALVDTLVKYRVATGPLLAPDVHASLCRAVDAFAAGEGPAIHAALAAHDATHPATSFISEMWSDAYLEARSPLPLALNPQLTWRDDPAGGAKMGQAARAADLLHASARYLLTLEAAALPPDVYWPLAHPAARSRALQAALRVLVPRRWAYYPFAALGAYALDMSQLPRLFRSTRVPGHGRDSLVSAARATSHVVVLAGRRAYALDVLTRDVSAPVAPAVLHAQLAAIVADAAGGAGVGKGPLLSPPPTSFTSPSSSSSSSLGEPPIGLLTSAPRDEWAAARAALAAGSPVNAASLAALDDAILVLTLDGSSPDDPAALSRVMLHGATGCDRWFDKCLNLVVAANGAAGVSWEHAWGDGGAVLVYMNAVFDAATAADPRHGVEPSPARIPVAPPPTSASPGAVAAAAAAAAVAGGGCVRLAWDVAAAPSVVAACAAARARFDAAVRATALRVFQAPQLTAGDVKASGLSPDGVMQMALQLAHVRAHGYSPSTYESASTAAFRHGRTETIRSASPESAAMCAVFGRGDGGGGGGSSGGGGGSLSARAAALAAATARHSRTARDAVCGHGIDRHMFALRKWAAKLSASPAPSLPALFRHPGHAIFEDIRLSTSTLASPALAGGGFGPVSASAYSVGYGIEERGAHFHVMGGSGGVTTVADPTRVPGAHPPTDVDAFTDAVERALRDIRDCLAHLPPAPPAARRGR